MEVTVHLDGDPTIRQEGFFAAKVMELENQIKELVLKNQGLGFENADLAAKNKELFERVDKLAKRQPSWPKGYRPNNRPRR
jgi:hypothetical protein